MPVDKFGRNGDRTTTIYSGINIANVTNSFLRRDEGNTAKGLLISIVILLKMYRIRCQIKVFATKNYVDTNAFTTASGVVSGDIKLSVGSDLVRSLGRIDMSAGKKFTFLLG